MIHFWQETDDEEGEKLIASASEGYVPRIGERVSFMGREAAPPAFEVVSVSYQVMPHESEYGWTGPARGTIGVDVYVKPVLFDKQTGDTIE
jgi:hypothetical protein